MSRAQGFSVATRRVIAARSSDYTGAPVCEIWAHCQGAPAVAAHHRRPRKAGGSRRPETNQPGNSLATCDPCHSWVESNREKAFEFGWLVRQHETPTDVQVLRRGVWVKLDDQGGFERVPAPQGGTAA